MWCRLFYEHFFRTYYVHSFGKPRGGRGVVGIPADDNAVGGYDVNSLVVAVGFYGFNVVYNAVHLVGAERQHGQVVLAVEVAVGEVGPVVAH